MYNVVYVCNNSYKYKLISRVDLKVVISNNNKKKLLFSNINVYNEHRT